MTGYYPWNAAVEMFQHYWQEVTTGLVGATMCPVLYRLMIYCAPEACADEVGTQELNTYTVGGDDL